jgi:pyroglutamyl-peptidase
MLRRRKKDQRDAKRAPRGPRGGGFAPEPSPEPAATPGSRRRGRRDAPVPAGLLIRGEPAAAALPGHKPRKAAKAGGGVVLVTGFDPFGGEQLNPSWEICRQLAGTSIDGVRVEACKLPCEFRRAIETVAAATERHRPALVIGLGQAGGRAQMSVERVAINVDDARIADNSGRQPIDEPIAAGGPAAYFATVPVKAMIRAMREANVPAQVSNTAGTYVCNHVMYGLLHFLAASGNPARAGFIHVPYAEEQVLDKPAIAALSLATMVRGVRAAIEAALRHASDIRVSEGSLD